MIVLFGLAGVLLFVLARRYELADRAERWVALVLVVLMVESFVYPSQLGTPAGPFRIPILSGGVRTYDLLVAIGLLARATVRPFPERLRADSVLWVLSGIWFSTAAVRGLVSGHGTNVVLFQAGSVLGMFGGFLLVAGCDPRRLASFFRARYVIPIGILVLALIPSESLEEPLALFGTGLGSISVDSASVFLAMAFVAVLIEWSRRPGSATAVWFCIPLIITPFAIEQRATLLHLGTSLIIVVLAVINANWNDRVHIKRVKLLWGFVLGVGVVMAVLMVSLSDDDGSVPLAAYYEETFQSEGQQLSAQARRDSFQVGMDEWRQQPIYGHGLGHTYSIQRPGSTEVVNPATFDNVPLDVLVRTGLVGFVLFVSAIVVSISTGWRVWGRSSDATVAAFALAATAVLVGLMVKAGFESILEKGKLALVWGMTAGAISSAARYLDRQDQAIGELTSERARRGGHRQWT